MATRILVGHVIDKLRDLPEASVQCVVTSPPYWGLRDYGTPPQVWGGDAGCEHVWGDERTVTAGRNDQDRDTRHTDGRNPETQGLVGCPKQVVSTGAFCSLCGAWRGNLGLEPNPSMFVAHIVKVFREVRRVLRDDGTVWLNLGDSYASTPKGSLAGQDKSGLTSTRTQEQAPAGSIDKLLGSGLKPKDMVGIPWRVAFALQADGWWLRNAIVWHKPNPMPESVTDRCTTSYEFVFLLAKAGRYYFDNEAIKEPSSENSHGGGQSHEGRYSFQSGRLDSNLSMGIVTATRNKRDVWTIATKPYSGAHFATFPEALVEPCIKAGTSEKGCCPECGSSWERVVEKVDTTEIRDEATGKSALQDSQAAARRLWERTRAMRASGYPHDQPFPSAITRDWHPICTHDLPPVPCQVLDPFLGSGTTAVVAQRLGRDCIGIELNESYAEMARQRIEGVQPVEVPGDNGDRLVVEQATMFGTVEVEATT